MSQTTKNNTRLPNKALLTNKSFPISNEPYGSVSEKKVNPDLQEERNKCNFD